MSRKKDRAQHRTEQAAAAPSRPEAAGTVTASTPSNVVRWLPLLIAAGVLLAYSNCYHGVFLLDDSRSIHDNPHIRTLWPLSEPLFGGINVARPLVSLSLAINYAIGGVNEIGYHAFNVGVHLLAALALFGVARRTLLRTPFSEHAASLAGGIAVLWSLHPLQTQSVTYIIQRSEAMMGMFLLLSLYCFIRGTDEAARNPRLWRAACVLACACGMACKQSMFAAPFLILLYDRTFVGGTFGAALRKRWLTHAALMATWGVLIFTIVKTPTLLGAGFGQSGITPMQYALSQCGVLLHYLFLSFWPGPLCLDYWWPVAKTAGEVIPGAIVILTLLALTGWALVRRPPWGFVGAWFFLILAPSSSVMPIVDLAFEQRMYLSLASIACVVTVVLFRLCQRISERPLVRFAAAVFVLAAALGVRTFVRNIDYASQLSMWGDVVAKRPNSPRGHNNYGLALFHDQQFDAAELHYRRALELEPVYWQAWYNLGLLHETRGDPEWAIAHYTRTLELNDYPDARPRLANLHNTKGLALRAEKKLPSAETEFRAAIKHDPGFWPARFNLGLVLTQQGKFAEAIPEYKETLRLNPSYTEATHQLSFAHRDWGIALLKENKIDAAVERLAEAVVIFPQGGATQALIEAKAKQADFDRRQAALLEKIRAAREALKGDPKKEELQLGSLNASNQLGLLLLERGKPDEAQRVFRETVQMRPDYWPGQYNLGVVALNTGKLDVALAHFRETLRLNPGYDLAKYHLANGLNTQGLALMNENKLAVAEALFREANAVSASYWQSRYNLGLVLERQGRKEAAIDAYTEALKLNPGYEPARRQLEIRERAN